MLLRVRPRCSDQDGGQAMTGGWHLSDSSVLLISVGSGLPEPGARRIPACAVCARLAHAHRRHDASKGLHCLVWVLCGDEVA